MVRPLTRVPGRRGDSPRIEQSAVAMDRRWIDDGPGEQDDELIDNGRTSSVRIVTSTLAPSA